MSDVRPTIDEIPREQQESSFADQVDLPDVARSVISDGKHAYAPLAVGFLL